jgi:hypothetical protein
LSTPTTRRAAVEVFDTASTRDELPKKVKVTLRLAVYGQSVCLGVKPLEKHDQRFFLPRVRVTLRLTVYRQSFRLGAEPLETHGQNIFFSQLNTCGRSPYITSSLTQSFLGPSHAGLVAIFYCLRFETPPTWRARSPYLYPPGAGWPSYTARHWVPFSSSPTTRRATVEAFEPASTRGTD